MAKFFRFPWAITGDRVAIPEPTEGSGAVSYAQGFGPDYEITPGDPGWRPVPRPETNQYLYDITDNLRQYQLFGAPDWYPASVNGGVAISYAINAIVRHNDLIYRSIVATNTVEPGTDPAKWVVDGVAGAATTAVAGITRYATPVEAAARVLTDRAVTPAGLGALYNLLLNQPFYPEVDTTDGKFTVTSPVTGTVRIAAGTTWTHRGAFTYTSVLTDLATVANKTYHLRWDRTNGFVLYDLSNGVYNPTAAAETSAIFDTTFDSMLLARVITSGGNVAAIRTLSNKNRLSLSGYAPLNASSYTWQENTGPNDITSGLYIDVDYARTPTAFLSGMNDLPFNNNAGASVMECNVGVRVVNRYQSIVYFQVTGSLSVNGLLTYTIFS